MKVKVFLFICGLLICNAILAQERYKCLSCEEVKAVGPDLKQIGWLIPTSSKDVKSSFWSINIGPVDRDFVNFDNVKTYVDDMGVTKARMLLGWAKCEKVKGEYDFEWLDHIMYWLKDHNIKMMPIFAYGNPVYGSELKLGAKLFSDEETMKAYLKWVEATVKRYKYIVNEWEIWNEPNLGNNGSKEYVNLLIKTVKSVKNIQPGATIIGFSTAGVQLKFTKEVFEGLKAENKLDIVDYLSFHPYSYNPDDSYLEIEKLQELVNSYNPKIKLFQNENGAPSVNHVYHALSNYPWTEVSQAKWFLRRMAGDKIRNIRSCIFSIVDMKYNEVLLSMGLLRANLQEEVLYKKPAYYGVRNMISFFDESVQSISLISSQKHIVKGEMIGDGSQVPTVEYKSDASRTISLARFEKESKPIILIWYNDNIPSDDFKWDNTDITIMNTVFKDPVYVEMISGKIYEIDKSDWSTNDQYTRFKKLPIWDSPMMILERSQINMD